MMSSRYFLKLTGLAVLLQAVIIPALAQNAQIGGRVTDPSGAVIPGTGIVIINTETGVQRKTTSNDEGYYAIPLLQPGHYQLTAQKDGFKPLSRDGIVLQVGDRITLNIALEIGASSEHVTVTVEVPLLRTEDAQAGLVIDNRRIMELPQYDRNALAFAQLAPNVNGQSSTGGYGQDFRINGGRTNQTEYILDGQPVTTGYKHDIPPSVPSKEAVAEFKVMTNGLSAEYGRLSGGAVILATRSGTNEFHGSAYEFFKNDKLNANQWKSNWLGVDRSVFHDNVFGFTFGGPVWIPKVYNGKDRTFFFVNYEGTRHVTGNNAEQASVPSMLERQGDFSQSLIDAGNPVQIYDPDTGRLVNGQLVRDPYPGMKIPQSRFDALAKIYTGYYPEPNTTPLPNTTNQNNYTYTRNKPSNNNRWTGRLDQNWNSNHSTHFSIAQYDYNQTTPRALSALEAVGLDTQTAYTASVEHDWTMSPTTIFTFRAGIVRSRTFSGSTVEVNDSGWN
ncbi:MAG TPA: carboxypeptidase regulatory-like domain-containing protein, partial [Bryobacteraceae bacterium]|nr:carboxypeptidase regulatory-like domain-containing protein [Bryobacteraceae bacterium]